MLEIIISAIKTFWAKSKGALFITFMALAFYWTVPYLTKRSDNAQQETVRTLQIQNDIWKAVADNNQLMRNYWKYMYDSVVRVIHIRDSTDFEKMVQLNTKIETANEKYRSALEQQQKTIDELKKNVPK